MASQHGDGSLTLGDSHEYGDAIGVYDQNEIDDLILSYLRRFLPISDSLIEQRWAGYYLKHPTEPWLVMQPEDRVHLLTGVGGAGMTLSFGLTEKVVTEAIGPV
jgi:glycine/D-amino acid oxidase-like deaminating enzyme